MILDQENNDASTSKIPGRDKWGALMRQSAKILSMLYSSMLLSMSELVCCLVVGTVLYCRTSWNCKKWRYRIKAKCKAPKAISLFECAVFHRQAYLFDRSIINSKDIYFSLTLKCISCFNCLRYPGCIFQILLIDVVSVYAKNHCNQKYNFNSATAMYLCFKWN